MDLDDFSENYRLMQKSKNKLNKQLQAIVSFPTEKPHLSTHFPIIKHIAIFPQKCAYSSPNQSIISSNSIQNITIFQQMSQKGSPSFLNILLQQIRHLLKEWTLRGNEHPPELQAKINTLTEQLHTQHLSPQRIISLMIGNQEAEDKLAWMIWGQLRKVRESGDLMREYQQLQKQTRQNYSIANSSLNTLLKEILENIKLITEELQHLTHNINSLPSKVIPLGGPGSPSQIQIPLYYLMRMAMEDTKIVFDEEMSQLLFRLYILEESTSLILVKSVRVFEELTEKLNDEATSRRSSMTTEKTGKRSALSESIEVFKRNQLRMELQRNDLLLPVGQQKGAQQIQSDYVMTRKAQRQNGKNENRITCCFRF